MERLQLLILLQWLSCACDFGTWVVPQLDLDDNGHEGLGCVWLNRELFTSKIEQALQGEDELTAKVPKIKITYN